MHIIPQKTKLNQQVIDILQEYLNLAKAGEILEVLIVAEKQDNTFAMQTSGYKDLAKTLGQIEMLRFDLIDQSLRK